MSRPRFELGTVCVLDRRDNRLHHRDLYGYDTFYIPIIVAKYRIFAELTLCY